MNKKIKQPFTLTDSKRSVIASVFCAAIGIFLGFIILLLINSREAPKALGAILSNFMYFDRLPQRLYYLGSTLAQSVPLILCGLSVLFAYKAGLFNIGVGGQYVVGICVSLWCALGLHMPWYLCVIFAMIAAGIFGAFAGALKAYFNVNEVIGGIMINWIGLYLTNVVMHNPKIMDLSISETYSVQVTSPASMIPKCGLDKLFHENQYVTIGILITIAVAILISITLNKTTFGYEIKATGFNKDAAKYAGMKEKRNIILTMAISGAIAGLAASLFYLTDVQHWKTSSSIPAMGFNGIAVAFLGGLNPIGVLFSGLFIEHITLGGSFIDTRYFTPQIAELISSIIIYICAFVLFIKEVIRRIENKRSEKIKKANKVTEA